MDSIELLSARVAAMQVVMTSLASSHPDKVLLLNRLGTLAPLQRDVLVNSTNSDEVIAEFDRLIDTATRALTAAMRNAPG